MSALARGWSFLVVNPKWSAKTLGDLIEMAKRAPGTLTYGAGGASSRVSVELFAQMAGIKLVYVAYKGNPLTVNDLVGGHIDLMITDSATGLPHVKGGTLRALGLAYLAREPGRTPVIPGSTSLADYTSGLYGALGVLMALRVKDRPSVGQVIALGLHEPIFRMMDELVPSFGKSGFVREPMGADTVSIVPHSHYLTRDGR